MNLKCQKCPSLKFVEAIMRPPPRAVVPTMARAWLRVPDATKVEPLELSLLRPQTRRTT